MPEYGTTVSSRDCTGACEKTPVQSREKSLARTKTGSVNLRQRRALRSASVNTVPNI